MGKCIISSFFPNAQLWIKRETVIHFAHHACARFKKNLVKYAFDEVEFEETVHHI